MTFLGGCIFSFCARLAPVFHRLRFSTVVEKLWIFRRLDRPHSMNIWKQVLDRLEQNIDRTEYVTWFAPTRFLAQKGNTIDVSVPSQRFVEAIRDRYGPQLRTLLDELSPDGVPLQVRFVPDTGAAADVPGPVHHAAELPASVCNPR